MGSPLVALSRCSHLVRMDVGKMTAPLEVAVIQIGCGTLFADVPVKRNGEDELILLVDQR